VYNQNLIYSWHYPVSLLVGGREPKFLPYLTQIQQLCGIRIQATTFSWKPK
jgi:hypothetical protein